METLLLVLRWLAAVPVAFYVSRFFGACFGMAAAKVFRGPTPRLALIGFFATGLLFVAVGGWIVPGRPRWAVWVLFALKLSTQPGRNTLSESMNGRPTNNALAETCGALAAALCW